MITSFVCASSQLEDAETVPLWCRATMPLPGLRWHLQPPRVCLSLYSEMTLQLPYSKKASVFAEGLPPRAFIAGCKQKKAFSGHQLQLWGQLILRNCSTADLDEKLSCKYGAFKMFMRCASFLLMLCVHLPQGIVLWKLLLEEGRGKFACNFAANDLHSADSQILDARVAFQRHRFGLNSCRILSRGLQQLQGLHPALLSGFSRIPLAKFPAVLHIQYIYSYANAPPHPSPLFRFFLMRARISSDYCVTETTLAWASSEWLGRIWSQLVIYWHQPGQLFPHLVCKGFCRIFLYFTHTKMLPIKTHFHVWAFYSQHVSPTPCLSSSVITQPEIGVWWFWAVFFYWCCF